MDNKEKSSITRTADYLIIPADIKLEEIAGYLHTPRILKKAIALYMKKDISLIEAMKAEPYLLPVLMLAEGMMEKSKGDWSIKFDNCVEFKEGMEIRIDLYGLESYFYEAREDKDGVKWILAGVATIQNANVPDWRVVLCKSGGVILRNKKLEGMIQGQRIQEAKSKKKELLEAYGEMIGEEEQAWIPLLEDFLEKSGL